MLNTRNIRVIVAAFLLFSVVGYFAFSAGSFTESINRVKPAASLDVDEEEGNTLQGSGHKGTEPPYKAVGNANQAQKLKGGDSFLEDDVEDEDEAPEVGKAEDAPKDSPGAGAQPEEGVKGTNGMVKKPGQGKKPAGAADGDKDQDKAEQGDEDSEKAEKVPAVADTEKSTSNAETDEDCKKTEYVVMIDAGSTGSRVHVYAFDTCANPPRLLSEKFEMLKPGLSSFDTDTEGAAKSLDPLLKVALEVVPEDQQGCTPVAVKATAGLRLLGKDKSDAILAEVRRHLMDDYPFAVVEGDGVSIMDGKMEGVYAWITTNYLLGNIGTKDRQATAAVFDLGGGSTQIVFEPEFGDHEKMAEGEHKFEFSFGDRQFVLYQFSHLGYGLMEGRNKINGVIVANALAKKQAVLTRYESKNAASDADALDTIINPCFPPMVEEKKVQVKLGENEFYVVNFKGPSEASGAQCRHIAERVLNMEAECKTPPCSFNGVYQPSLVKTFHKDLDMWVFSYFYDRTNPLGFPGSFKMDELMDLTKKVCLGLDLWADVLLDDSVQQLNSEPSWCLDLSFITAMLHTGYNIPLSRELKTAKTIANNELGWCLGASLPLLNSKEGHWTCRVKETS